MCPALSFSKIWRHPTPLVGLIRSWPVRSRMSLKSALIFGHPRSGQAVGLDDCCRSLQVKFLFLFLFLFLPYFFTLPRDCTYLNTRGRDFLLLHCSWGLGLFKLPEKILSISLSPALMLHSRLTCNCLLTDECQPLAVCYA